MEELGINTTQEVSVNNDLGFFKRLVNIIFEPKTVFESIRIKPALLIQFIFIAVMLSVLVIPKYPAYEAYSKNSIDKVFKSEKFMKSNNLSSDAAAKIIESQEKYMKAGAYFNYVGVPLLMILISSLLLFGVFKAFGGSGTFKQTLAVVLYTYSINILGEIVRTINVVLSGNFEVTNSLGLFMANDKTSIIYNLLNSIDFFSVWATIIMAVGLAIVHKVKIKKAYIGSFSVWGLGIIIYVIYMTIQATAYYKQYDIML